MSARTVRAAALVLVAAALGACKALGPEPEEPAGPAWDDSAYLAHVPRSILVLPPTNDSVEVAASYACLSAVGHALTQRGYYVFPVAIVDEILRLHGRPAPTEMHGTPRETLREAFGADAVLYLEIRDWGTSYGVVNTRTTVQVDGRLVDLASGDTIWTGRWRAHADSFRLTSDAYRNPVAFAVATAVAAVIAQILGSVGDSAHTLAANSASGWVGGAHDPLPVGPLHEDHAKDLEARRAAHESMSAAGAGVPHDP